MPQKCIEGSCRKRPLSVETVREYVAENPLTEPEGLLLRGSAAMRFSITAWNGSSGSAPAWARGSGAPH